MKHLPLTKMLLGVAFYIVMNTGYCADIPAPVGYSTGDSSKLPIVYTEQDSTELYAFNQAGQAELSILHPGTRTKTLTLPQYFIKVTRINQAVSNKAVIIGVANEALSVIVVVDVANDAMIDTFLAYDPVISPNGRYIAFTKFYPTHGIAGTRDLEMVYDLTQSPSANRPVGNSTNDDTDVGEAVYPLNVTASSPTTGVPEADAVSVTSDFYWSLDSSKLLFSAVQTREPPQSVTVQQNSPPLSKEQVNVVLIRPGAASGKTRTFQAALCIVGRGACADRMTDVSFGSHGVDVGFASYGPGVKSRLLHINYAQFSDTR